MQSLKSSILVLTGGNLTTGSRCNLLVGQAHSSESCQVHLLSPCGYLGRLWLQPPAQLASFQNWSVLRRLVYGLFKLTHVSCEDHTAHYIIMWAHWASNTELSTPQTLQPWWISEKLLYCWVSKKLQSQWRSPNLRRPFLRACEFSKLFCNYFPTSSVIRWRSKLLI